MAYGFQIYGATGNLHFDSSSLCLMLHDKFEVTGTSSFNKTYVWSEDVTAAFLVVEEFLYDNVNFLFNMHVAHGATITYPATRTVNLAGNPIYSNVGMNLGGSWSTYVNNSTLRYLIYVA